MRETCCRTSKLWALLSRLLAQPMLAACLVHTVVVAVGVMVPSGMPTVAWRVALGCRLHLAAVRRTEDRPHRVYGTLLRIFFLWVVLLPPRNDTPQHRTI